MSVLDSLVNKGVFALNKAREPVGEKTVVVLGLARGGTTMVASVLQALGVPMGTLIGPVMEDHEVSEAIEARDLARLKELVAVRDAEHRVWGWKRPAAFRFSDVWQGAFRNPHIIAVFRDPFAIANRNRISMLTDLFTNMRESIATLEELVTFLERQDCPLLLCSYEKVLMAPSDFVAAVGEFLELDAVDRYRIAAREIQPSPEEYLKNSRITQSRGNLDLATENFCSGWAFYTGRPERPVTVEVFLNDRPVLSAVADQMRPDLQQAGLHPDGRCGFRAEWPEGQRAKIGDEVKVQVEGDIDFIDGSPRRVE